MSLVLTSVVLVPIPDIRRKYGNTHVEPELSIVTVMWGVFRRKLQSQDVYMGCHNPTIDALTGKPFGGTAQRRQWDHFVNQARILRL